MKHKVDDELFTILEGIASERKSLEEWGNLESSDMFQTKNYEGGFDATEKAFCFSYYDDADKEWWFQVSLHQIDKILERKQNFIECRRAS